MLRVEVKCRESLQRGSHGLALHPLLWLPSPAPNDSALFSLMQDSISISLSLSLSLSPSTYTSLAQHVSYLFHYSAKQENVCYVLQQREGECQGRGRRERQTLQSSPSCPYSYLSPPPHSWYPSFDVALLVRPRGLVNEWD